MTKTHALLLDLKNASGRLKEATGLSVTPINQDATIRRFEFSFELSWKLMQSILAENGIEAYGPKNAIRESAKLGLIDNPQRWLEFLKARNLTTHTYKEELAKQVYKEAKVFVKTLEEFVKKAQEFKI